MLKRVLELQLIDDEGEVKLTLRGEEHSDKIMLVPAHPKLSITAAEIKEALDILENFGK